MARRRARRHSPSVTAWARAVRDLRTAMRLSLTGFAQLVGVVPQTVYRWEHGEAVPRLSAQRRLDDLTGRMRRDAKVG